MVSSAQATIAIVDYGLGNLYSVKHACAHVGVSARITSDPSEILDAAAVILPGVGAFGDAMTTLHRLDLVAVVHDFVATGRPFVGICLGMQLLMTESEEFGAHRGLGLIEGTVAGFQRRGEEPFPMKVPQVGWNHVYRVPAPAAADPWAGTWLQGLSDGEAMYFVHSFVVQPSDATVELSRTSYGEFEFCSSVRLRNVVACQFHPERSGPQGLQMYQTLADQVRNQSKNEERV